ncbi:MAG TPA: alkaline phosphatase family protein [Kofleriaceae bacterium]|nr:alkaline phosphatase family protein [Kofleriaceae bacterium]
MKRRDALKAIGQLSAAAGMASLLPGCGGGDGGGDGGGSNDAVGITTYVYMMMENRSYDHFFGARSLREGKPGDGLTAQMSNNDINGVAVPPFEADRQTLCDIDPPHGWDELHASWNQGACDGFLVQHQKSHGNDATARQPMQYLTREFAPVSYALADAYATNDRWFCSVMGPTWPNRFYWHLASAEGIMADALPAGPLKGPSIYDRLNDKGVPWAYYFGSLPVVPAVTHVTKDQVDKNVKFFAEFLNDAAAGTLPPVVYIDPAFNMNDDHPPVHPINGQQLIWTVYTALAKSPQWKNCLLVITYDENGGFFDHVSPPTTKDDRAADGFDQMGFRVPTLVAGPYVKTGHVSSVVRDHTSALHELEVAFNLEPINQRTMAANDLSELIDTERLAAGKWNPPIELPTVDPTTWPQPQECFGGSLFAPVPHPIIEWADRNPDKIAGMDRRGDAAEYRQLILDFIAKNSGATSSTKG